MRVSFPKDVTKILQSVQNAPLTFNTDSGQAEAMSVQMDTFFWGCPVTNFKASLPFL
jgi:hypothetical protein